MVAYNLYFNFQGIQYPLLTYEGSCTHWYTDLHSGTYRDTPPKQNNPNLHLQAKKVKFI